MIADIYFLYKAQLIVWTNKCLWLSVVLLRECIDKQTERTLFIIIPIGCGSGSRSYNFNFVKVNRYLYEFYCRALYLTFLVVYGIPNLHSLGNCQPKQAVCCFPRAEFNVRSHSRFPHHKVFNTTLFNFLQRKTFLRFVCRQVCV